jgi:hypothetical protein
MAKIHNLILKYKNERDCLRKQPQSEDTNTRLIAIGGALEALNQLKEDKKK